MHKHRRTHQGKAWRRSLIGYKFPDSEHKASFDTITESREGGRKRPEAVRRTQMRLPQSTKSGPSKAQGCLISESPTFVLQKFMAAVLVLRRLSARPKIRHGSAQEVVSSHVTAAHDDVDGMISQGKTQTKGGKMLPFACCNALSITRRRRASPIELCEATRSISPDTLIRRYQAIMPSKDQRRHGFGPPAMNGGWRFGRRWAPTISASFLCRP